MSAVAHAQPCWTELTTTDLPGAEKFYAQLLGWEIEERTRPGGADLVATIDGQEVAGITAWPPGAAGAPSTWTVYCWVDDVGAVVAHTAAAGGSVLEAPVETSDGRHMATVGDPTGAVLGLISGSWWPGPIYSSRPGTLSWFELMTRNCASAARFYADLLGWRTATSDAGSTEYSVFLAGDLEIGGMIAMPPDVGGDVPDAWSVYFAVDDCAATEAMAQDLGGHVVKSATPTPMGPFAVIADPRGAVFQISQFAGA